MDAHIHHGLALPQAVGTHGTHFAHGDHDHIGFSAQGGKIPGAGIADGHSGVLTIQHHGGGLAHHKAAAHYDSASAGKRNLVILQDFKAGLRSAGGVAEVGIGEYSGQRTVRDAVNVLFRSQSRTHSAVVKLFGQGTEQQTAMDGILCVDLGDHLQQLVLRGIGGQQKLLYFHADLAAAGDYAALVGEVVLPFAHTNYGQRGHDAFCFELLAQCGVALVHGGHNRRTF